MPSRSDAFVRLPFDDLERALDQLRFGVVHVERRQHDRAIGNRHRRRAAVRVAPGRSR